MEEQFIIFLGLQENDVPNSLSPPQFEELVTVLLSDMGWICYALPGQE